MKNLFTIIFILSLSLFSSGCLLVPFIDSFKSSGVLEEDRQRLLQERIVHFQRARSWGKSFQVLEFVTATSRPTMRKVFSKGSNNKEKVVESTVDDLLFQEEARKAEVFTTVKYFQVPYYVVEERQEKQLWTFTMTDGWLLDSLEDVKEG